MASRLIVLTFDVENDCSLDSFKGIELGLPKILELLEKFRIPATFFVTAEVAELYPEVVHELGKRYEVGCHGYHHESFQKIDSNKKNILESAKKVIEETTGREVLGFRAPYLRVSHGLFNTLVEVGFQYDSSLAWFKISHWQLNPPIREFRLMFPNVSFRFPLGSSLFKVGSLLQKIPVLYFHPWEGIDVRNLFLNHPRYVWNIIGRPDRWFNSGERFLSLLSTFIQSQLSHGFQFRTLKDIYFASI